jgi:hypothetical protein
VTRPGPAEYHGLACVTHTLPMMENRWEDWYEIWQDGTAVWHARARADGSMVHRPTACALNRELEDDFSARRAQHLAHHGTQRADCL